MFMYSYFQIDIYIYMYAIVPVRVTVAADVNVRVNVNVHVNVNVNVNVMKFLSRGSFTKRMFRQPLNQLELATHFSHQQCNVAERVHQANREMQIRPLAKRL